MQAQDGQAEQTAQAQQPDPATVALDAINDFDRYMAEHSSPDDEAWRLVTRAELRVAWASLAEQRRLTNLLTGILAKLQAIEYNTRSES